jgi:hypothetical protein
VRRESVPCLPQHHPKDCSGDRDDARMTLVQVSGYTVSDETVGNVLKRHGIEPATKRGQKTTWKEFFEGHLAVLAGIDFLTVEVSSACIEVEGIFFSTCPSIFIASVKELA